MNNNSSQKKPVTSNNFVAAMLQSTQENREAQPQTRYDNVNPADIEKLMADLKKGKLRK